MLPTRALTVRSPNLAAAALLIDTFDAAAGLTDQLDLIICLQHRTQPLADNDVFID